ncbi:uncharacterized protein [Procambarus clarkii]|uniref:uncharacterized protein n=1 Tax=Procambarus clarkii TaxID=6728 RepID=UPI00374368EF
MCAVDQIIPHPVTITLPPSVLVLEQVCWRNPLMASLPAPTRRLPGDEDLAEDASGACVLAQRHQPQARLAYATREGGLGEGTRLWGGDATETGHEKEDWQMGDEGQGGGGIVETSGTLVVSRADTPLTSGADNPLTSGADNPLTPGADNPLTLGADNPLTPGADTPLTPGADNPLTPGADNPLTPGADNPLTPGADTPLTPGADNPLTPGADNPLTPGADNPLTPGADNPLTPGTDTPLTPGADNLLTLGADNLLTPGADHRPGAGACGPAVETLREEGTQDDSSPSSTHRHTHHHLTTVDVPSIYCLHTQHDRSQKPKQSGAALELSLISYSGIFPGEVTQVADYTSGSCGDNELTHHDSLSATCTPNTSTQQDCNNNLQKSKDSLHSEEPLLDLAVVNETVHASELPTERQDMVLDHTLWRSARHKWLQRRHVLTKAVAETFSQIKSFYKGYKYTRRRGKIKWSNSPICGEDMKRMGEARIVQCNNEQEVSDRQARDGGMRSGKQRGDQSPASKGTHWWQTRGRNNENGRDNGGGRGQHSDTVRKSGTHTSTISSFQRSIDMEANGRRKKTKTLMHSMRRSVSIEHDRSDDVYLKTIKYRDKSQDRRAMMYVSSSSEDPPTGLQATLRARPQKPWERKRPSPTRRAESASRRAANDQSRARRRQAKKTEQSSSSPSSSSSRSGSIGRSKAVQGPRPASPATAKNTCQVSTDMVHVDESIPLEGNSKDNTKEFLERLDSVLSDLVENEKKKISKYGHSSVKSDEAESGLVTLQPRKKRHKKRDESKERVKKVSDNNDVTSPSLQQLRETLKAVRVRKRAPASADLLDKHSQRFTERQPHNPRILKSEHASQLVNQRCYQPPRRRPPRPRPHPTDFPSDFYSSDEDHQEQRRRGSTEPTSVEETEPEAPDEVQCKNGDVEDDDTCYGSDYQASQAQHPRPSAHDHTPQRPLDSGDFSVDSAYTGSRGATPESILNPGVKPRRQGSNLTSPLVTAKPRQPRSARRLPPVEPLQQLKRTILKEIRESKLYSDESINSLLEQYRRKCSHFSPADLDIITRSVQDDLGVKPRPAQFLYQILVGGDDDHTQPVAADKSLGDAEDTSLLTLQSTGKIYGYGRRRRRETGVPGRPHSSTSRYTQHMTNKTITTHRPRRSQEETEDEAWARAAVGVVAPELVTQAREEAQQRQDADPETDWSHYVAQLCQQFEIKM